MHISSPPQHILFLDADCVFCQRSAVLLHRINRRGDIYFAPLQGETAAMLPEKWRDVNDVESAAVFVENSGTPEEAQWRGCDAILRSLRLSGFPFCLLWLAHWLPAWVKNQLYQKVASIRYRLSKHVSCPLPSEEFLKQVLP